MKVEGIKLNVFDTQNLTPSTQNLLLSPAPSEASLLARGVRRQGAVFTMSNAEDGNVVWAFERDHEGRLTPAGEYPTEGDGSGDGLNGTSNPMALGLFNKYLFVVNGGSDEISVFRVDGAHLTLVRTQPSGGPRPISITYHRGLVYVLNAGREGEPGNITGFIQSFTGRLFAINGSTQPLPDGAAGTSQIGFSPRGNLIVVTDKPTNAIITYEVSRTTGVVGPPNVQPSNGETAFGFDFDRRSRLFVSEAFGGADDASAVSAYRLDGRGQITTLAESIPTTETAACWVEVFGRYAYTTNTGSSSVTGFRIQRDGSLHLLNDDGVTITTGDGSRPLDMAIAFRYLYVHSQGTDRIGVYRINHDGSLESVPDAAASGLPSTAVGVAAF